MTDTRDAERAVADVAQPPDPAAEWLPRTAEALLMDTVSVRMSTSRSINVDDEEAKLDDHDANYRRDQSRACGGPR